ncbi:MAG: ferric reductase-like transmembrane domain-containing protein [Candidatus Dormibacter sp.]
MNDTLLWYTTRAAGAVSLVLLSIVTALGLLTAARAGGGRWPRFMTAALHRDLALVALVFLTLHIVTAAVDPFTHLGIAAVVVPFGSYYRTFWLGLGTVAFELLLAVIATSLLLRVVSLRAWRLVHWTSYAMWPIAVVHGIGTGTDSFSLIMLAANIACVGLVGCAALWRLMTPTHPLVAEKRVGVALASAGPRR